MRRAYIFLHTAIFLFGFTGILGEFLKANGELHGAAIVWWRIALTVLSFCLFPGIFKKIKAIPKRDLWKAAGIGLLIASHWVTFFGAIILSNASVTISILASAAFFTSILEPILLNRKFNIRESILGGLVIIGFIFIFSFTKDEMFWGIIAAIVSAFLAALFGVLNKDMVGRHDVFALSLVEFASGLIFLSLMLPVYQIFYAENSLDGLIPAAQDWKWLVILAWLCTTLAFSLLMFALRKLTAFTAALAVNLEPIYTILLAAFLFYQHENLHIGFYGGAVIIILSVLLNGLMTKE